MNGQKTKLFNRVCKEMNLSPEKFGWLAVQSGEGKSLLGSSVKLKKFSSTLSYNAKTR